MIIQYNGGHSTTDFALPGPFHTLAEVKQANAKVGHYFERATMRFFRSRPNRTVTQGRFFIDSIQFVSSQGIAQKRRYKVCVVADNGDVDGIAFPIADCPLDLDTVVNSYDAHGYRETFASLYDARRTLRQYLKGVK